MDERDILSGPRPIREILDDRARRRPDIEIARSVGDLPPEPLTGSQTIVAAGCLLTFGIGCAVVAVITALAVADVVRGFFD